MKRKILSLIFILSMVILPLNNVNAAGLSISASSKSVTTGGTVRITVNASGIAGRFSITSSNSNVLSGGAGSEWLENESKSYTFSAKSTGSATITVTPINAAYSDGSGKVTGGKSVTINVVKPREKSTNNNLKSLGVEGYTITPDFNKDTLEYSLELDSSVEKINIQASLEDGYASVSGNGEKEVVEGANKFEITATSETGSSKTYTLNVNVKDNNPVEEKVDGKTYSLVKRASSLTLPEGVNKELFTETKVTIDEVEVPAYTNEEQNLTLVGLRDEDGTIYLYKVEDGKISDKYEIITTKGLTILFQEPKEVLKDYEKTSVKIGDKEYTAYKNESLKDYVLIYGTNTETNESGWYSYNLKENSIQTYMKDVIDEVNDNCNKKIDEYKTVIMVLSGLSVLLLIITIITIITKIKSRKELKDKVEKFIEETKELKIVKEDKEEKKEELEVLEETVEVKEEKVEELSKKDKKKKGRKKNDELEEKTTTADLSFIIDEMGPIATQVPTEEKENKKKEKKEESSDVITQEDVDDISDDFLDEREKRKRQKKLNKLK